MLINLPKLIFIVHVCPFLQIDEVNKVSMVCLAMRRTIYGPIGWAVLSYSHSPYPIRFKEVPNDNSRLQLKEGSDS